jgi:hypothetical protein
VGEPGSIFQKSSDEFARRANAKLGDKAKVVVYGSSQLGGDKEMIQKVKLGTMDMAVPSTVMSSEVDLFGIFEMPYIVRTASTAKIEAGPGRCSSPRRRRKGLRYLRYGKTDIATSPTASVPSSSRPICRASSCVCPKESGE